MRAGNRVRISEVNLTAAQHMALHARARTDGGGPAATVGVSALPREPKSNSEQIRADPCSRERDGGNDLDPGKARVARDVENAGNSMSSSSGAERILLKEALLERERERKQERERGGDQEERADKYRTKMQEERDHWRDQERKREARFGNYGKNCDTGRTEREGKSLAHLDNCWMPGGLLLMGLREDISSTDVSRALSRYGRLEEVHILRSLKGRCLVKFKDPKVAEDLFRGVLGNIAFPGLELPFTSLRRREKSWTCPKCEIENSMRTSACILCRTLKPSSGWFAQPYPQSMSPPRSRLRSTCSNRSPENAHTRLRTPPPGTALHNREGARKDFAEGTEEDGGTHDDCTMVFDYHYKFPTEDLQLLSDDHLADQRQSLPHVRPTADADGEGDWKHQALSLILTRINLANGEEMVKAGQGECSGKDDPGYDVASEADALDKSVRTETCRVVNEDAAKRDIKGVGQMGTATYAEEDEEGEEGLRETEGKSKQRSSGNEGDMSILPTEREPIVVKVFPLPKNCTRSLKAKFSSDAPRKEAMTAPRSPTSDPVTCKRVLKAAAGFFWRAGDCQVDMRAKCK